MNNLSTRTQEVSDSKTAISIQAPSAPKTDRDYKKAGVTSENATSAGKNAT